MAMQVKVGSFTKRADTVLGTQAVTGVGFQPKAIIFFGVWATANGFVSSSFSYLGFATATEDYGIGLAQEDAVATTGADRASAAKAIISNRLGLGAPYFEADLQTMDTDGFTLNWTTNSVATAVIINYIALGGTDLINAKVVSWAPSTSAGDKSVTGVGFKPDCVIHMSDVSAGALPSDFDNAYLGFGAMDKNGNQWATSFFSRDNWSPSDASRGLYTDKCLAIVDIGDVLWGAMSFKSMDADGFTLNQSLPTASTFGNTISLCLRGGSYKVGNFIGAGGVQKQRLDGFGFRPKGILASHIGATSARNAQNGGAVWGLGAASDVTAEKGIGITDQDNLNPTVVKAYQADKMLSLVYASSTIDMQADLDSINSDGVTLNWTTNFGTAGTLSNVPFGYLAVGDA